MAWDDKYFFFFLSLKSCSFFFVFFFPFFSYILGRCGKHASLVEEGPPEGLMGGLVLEKVPLRPGLGRPRDHPRWGLMLRWPGGGNMRRSSYLGWIQCATHD